MEKLSLVYSTKTYYLLTKPGIILGNLITTGAGFILASRGQIDYALFFTTLIGLSFVIGSACVFNNCIDRVADEKMKRTQERALVRGLISVRYAQGFAVLLGVLGTLLLAVFANALALAAALVGFFVYVLLYSFSKYHSIYGTVIGSIAGAVPPVVGYCAASNALDLGALLLFAMIVLWQMPHFFAIAIYHLEDYAAASIPVLPLKKGMRTTKLHMLVYIGAFFIVCSLLSLFHYAGALYLSVSSLLSLGWLGLCLKGFACKDDRLWARQMFIFSLIVVTGISLVIPFSL